MATPNVIYKLVQLILDKVAAQKMEQDAKQSTGKVDQELNLLQRTAQRLAAALAAAFAINKIREFAVESVRAAQESERSWSSLRQTIKAAGGDVETLVPTARKASQAFAAATVHDDDSFAESLQRMIALTGDTTASLNNMGLVANVAATFFDGELAPAAELVSKVMNGNVAMLGRMGIEAKSAQEGLEILARRSMGAATQEAGTMAGQLKQLNNEWGEFKEDIGAALTGTNAQAGAMTVLRDLIKDARSWLDENQDRVREWVTNGINFAITAVDVLYRAVMGMANLFQGAFNYALGVAAQGLGMLATGYANAIEALAEFRGYFSPDDYAAMLRHAAGIRQNAEALNEWAAAAKEAGAAQVGKGVDILSTPVFTPPSGQRPQVPELQVNSPMVANEHRKTLDELARFDQEYWRKRIRLTNQGMATIKAAEQNLGQGIRTELTATQEVAAELGAELVGAMGAGIGPAAAGKAKQNALEAAELTIRAGIASLNPFTAWMAPGYLQGAAAHAGLAVAWGALSAAFGGAGGGGDVSMGAGGGVSAVGESAGPAAESEPPGVFVEIHIDGLDPQNTRHQALLAQTNQQVKERYGENSQITIV